MSDSNDLDCQYLAASLCAAACRSVADDWLRLVFGLSGIGVVPWGPCTR